MFYCSSVSLPCSGSAMLTRSHIVPRRGSTPSLQLFTRLWWGFMNVVNINSKYPDCIFCNEDFYSLHLALCLSVKRLTCCFSVLSRELRTGENKIENGVILCFMKVVHSCVYSLLSDFLHSPPVFLLPSLKLELITSQAMRAGFSGGMVVDYPNSSKAKKSVPL